MNGSILALATAVPDYQVKQSSFADILSLCLNLESVEVRLLKKIFKSAKIQKRYSVIPDYENASLEGSLYTKSFPDELPGSFKRNRIYKEEAPELALKAAEKALKQWGGDVTSITHVISVSCTGLMAPGIEFSLTDSLGLRRDVSRLGINFMGCFGAFQGLETARSFAVANPGSRVLLVCTELCSLHMQPSGELSKIIPNALFADGSAAVVVGVAPTKDETLLWEIVRKTSHALENSLNEMTWEMGNDGCIMQLTDQVPNYVKKSIKGFIGSVLKDDVPQSACEWLVHPGGKAILNAVAQACDLDSETDLKPSWEVMRDYGNMSSATFLFVLERALKKKKYAIGVGFGPGLSLEGILLKNASS